MAVLPVPAAALLPALTTSMLLLPPRVMALTENCCVTGMLRWASRSSFSRASSSCRAGLWICSHKNPAGPTSHQPDYSQSADKEQR